MCRTLFHLIDIIHIFLCEVILSHLSFGLAHLKLIIWIDVKKLLQWYYSNTLDPKKLMGLWCLDMVQFNGPTLPLWHTMNIRFKFSSWGMNWNVKIEQVYLLSFIITIWTSTMLFLISKMKLSMHMCQFFSNGYTYYGWKENIRWIFPTYL
jgi:hypothetical protein